MVYVYGPFDRVWAEEPPLRFSWIKEYMFIYLQTYYEKHWILRMIFYSILGFRFLTRVPMGNNYLPVWALFYAYTGWPRNNGTVDTVYFSGLCCNQNLFSSPFWIEHLFPIIITPRSSDLVENFLFYETFLMDCHFRDLPDFQSFEARWQINGKSKKWQSIRNYSRNIKFSTKFGDLGVIIMRKNALSSKVK